MYIILSGLCMSSCTAPSAPILAAPLINCSNNDETMALVEISWMVRLITA